MSGAHRFKKCWNLSAVCSPTGTAVSGSSLFAFYTIMPTTKALSICKKRSLLMRPTSMRMWGQVAGISFCEEVRPKAQEAGWWGGRQWTCLWVISFHRSSRTHIQKTIVVMWPEGGTFYLWCQAISHGAQPQAHPVQRDKNDWHIS